MIYSATYNLIKQAADPSTYAIQRGDTFEGLDKRYKLPIGSFQQANPSVVPTKMQIGQKLIVPKAIPAEPKVTAPGTVKPKPAAAKQSYHIVKAGDNFESLDKKYKLGRGAFQKANPKAIPTRLQIGQKLLIPTANKPAASDLPEAQNVQWTSKFFNLGGPTDYLRRRQPSTPNIYSDIAFRHALYSAETGGNKNPFIRTLGVPKNHPNAVNTAYGPGQITALKASDYFNRFPYIMKDSKPFYAKVMAPMYKKFIQYSKTPGTKLYGGMWGYGGTGKPFSEDEKQQYHTLMSNMLRADKKEADRLARGGNDHSKLLKRIQLWRGVKYDKDSKYYNKVLDNYHNFNRVLSNFVPKEHSYKPFSLVTQDGYL